MSDDNNNSKKIKIEIHNIVFFIALLIAITLCLVLHSFYKDLNIQLAMLGTAASVIGLWVAVDQIFKTKSIAKETQTTANNTLIEVKTKIKQVNKAFTLSDVSIVAKFPSEINENIAHCEYERAYDKMERLQENLIELSNNPRCNENIDEINSFVADLTIRMRSIKNSIKTRHEPYGSDDIDDLMNRIRVFLVKETSKMKYAEISEV